MSTDKNTIDSYNSYAEKWAQKMRSGENVAHEYLEKPAMYAKLPDLSGLRVLCLGCGTGEECAHLTSLGAKVVGVDISEGLIEYAKKSYPELEFHVMDMEQLDFPPESFDFVYSSLVMHYVEPWQGILKSLHTLLKKGGRFLFSTHHPVRWGSQKTYEGTNSAVLMGYKKFKASKTCEVVGDYLTTRRINDTWFEDFKVSYIHRSMQEILKDIIDSDFDLIDFIEPKPTDTCREADPVFWEIHQKIPLFMVFDLLKK